MNDNVIPFNPNKRVYQLQFKTPAQIRMYKSENCEIQLELTREMDDLMGSGVAWVPAVTKTEAQQKLLDLLNATEIKFVGELK